MKKSRNKEIERKAKRLCSDNRGLSLLEILVALVIFAMLVTPIFKSFSVSAQVNLKSKRLLSATNVAETVMEDIASHTYNDVTMAAGVIKGYNSMITGTDEIILADDDLFKTSAHIAVSNAVTSTSDFVNVLKGMPTVNNASADQILYKATSDHFYVAYVNLTPDDCDDSAKDFRYAAVASIDTTNASNANVTVLPIIIDIYVYQGSSGFFENKYITVNGSMFNK